MWLPSPLLLLLLALGLAPALWVSGAGSYAGPLALYDAGLLALMLLDWLLTPRQGLEIEREVDDPLAVGVGNPVRLRLRNRCDHALWLWVRDDPPDWVPRRRFGPLRLAPGEEQDLLYEITPTRRGRERFGAVTVRRLTRLGLGLQQVGHPLQREVNVYPNLRDVERFRILAHHRRLEEMGLRWTRLRGQGSEFESLRDYLPDDDSRRIHWKATARRGRLTAIDYQVERSQPILLAVDCGRLMATRVGALTKLDHAINAALMLAYVAAQMDDQVGLLVFADEVLSYHPPRRGLAHVYRLAEVLAGVQVRFLEPDYLLALETIRARLRRRSLVVMFSDFLDADSARPWLTRVAALAPRHLPLLVAFTHHDIWDAARRAPAQSAEAYQKALASRWLEERATALRSLQRQGLNLVESAPDRLTLDVVREYLEIKARARL